MTKANRTGRSSGKWTVREKRIWGPPDGKEWIWETSEMKCSPAWRAMGINARRLIDFLEVDHRNHAGRENGYLGATYDQLEERWIGRRHIKSAIEECEFLGFVRVERGGYLAGRTEMNLYRLTFYADKEGAPATNEWKGITEEAIQVWRANRAEIRRSKKNSTSAPFGNNPVHLLTIVGDSSEGVK